jgi:hypothetical protein
MLALSISSVCVNSILQLPAPPVFSTSMRTCVALLVLKMTERQTMELETDMTDTCSTRTSQFAQVDRSSRVWGRKALTFWELLDATRGGYRPAVNMAKLRERECERLGAGTSRA